MSDLLHVHPAYQPMFRQLGIDAQEIFTHPEIHVWRKLADRENATFDFEGQRFHVKRYPDWRIADREVAGLNLLIDVGIPTMDLVAWGQSISRGFVIFADLAGYEPADKAIERGRKFEDLLEPTAALAARLHAAGLHHRDLYLCHFFVNVANDVRLIDVARVAKLPMFLAKRWIVKDLAQFWYSSLALTITDEQRDRWLASYCEKRGIAPTTIKPAILRKASAIARHDKNLRQKQPSRNISIEH